MKTMKPTLIEYLDENVLMCFCSNWTDITWFDTSEFYCSPKQNKPGIKLIALSSFLHTLSPLTEHYHIALLQNSYGGNTFSFEGHHVRGLKTK